MPTLQRALVDLAGQQEPPITGGYPTACSP